MQSWQRYLLLPLSCSAIKSRKSASLTNHKSYGTICLSEDRFNLAKNAETSIERIERLDAHNLPLSAEIARNLPSLGPKSRELT